MPSPCWKGIGDAAPYVPGLPERVGRYASLPALFSDMACCTRCPLAEGRTQVVPGVGPCDAKIMLIGEGPGANEDAGGAPFVGRAGALLDRLLSGAGIRRADVFITNLVACRPPKNRAPRVGEVRAHEAWLSEQIRLVRPRVIGTLGRSPLGWFEANARITEIHGQPRAASCAGVDFTLLPLYHPAAALRNPHLVPTCEADFARLRELLV